ncbi:MAG: hypothetical protein JW730_01845 [Anaerolineales bacterium]|nr:hypothetical protein [Anaerolineales bacterium]
MYILRPDEKTTPVMLYTQQSVVRGDLVTKQSVLRVNIWLRTDGAPRYLHILKPHVLVFGGGPAKALSYSEIYFPASEAVAFHTLPPTDEPLDYDSGEANRTMEAVEVLVGTFVMKGKLRISTQTEISASLEMARVNWTSIYDVSVSNPHLPQMATLQVPMALVNPNRVAFTLA